MICNRFATCATHITSEEITVRTKKKLPKKKRKGNRNTQKEFSYKNYPCENEQRMNQCVVFSDYRSKASCTEKGKTYTLDHSEKHIEVLCMHIDSGVIDDAELSRCDYVLFVRDKVNRGHGRAIFVELKGCNTKKALKQLIETLKMPEVIELSKKYKKVYGRVVNSSCVPRIQNTGEYLELKELLMMFGGNLKTGEWNFVERYAELDI